jgi:hypothetical protein
MTVRVMAARTACAFGANETMRRWFLALAA